MRFKELLIGLALLGFILMLIGFTVPSNTPTLTTYVYLDGAFVLKDSPFYLDQNTYSSLLVGRYTLDMDTLKGTKASFIWNEQTLTGRIVRVDGSILYVNVSGMIYRVPITQAALERIDNTVKVTPEDIVGVGVRSLKWEGETILYYGTKPSLDIGVTLINQGDWEYVGPIYLIATDLPRQPSYYYRYYPMMEKGLAPVEPMGATESLDYEEESALSSRLVYKINNIKLDPYQTISKSLKKEEVSVERKNILSLYLRTYRSSGNPELTLMFKSPTPIPPGKLYVLDEKGRYLYQGRIEETPANKTVSLELYPNPYVVYNYTVHYHMRENTTYYNYTLSLTNYNNITELIDLSIQLPYYGLITVRGDLEREGDYLRKEVSLLPGQTVTYTGQVVIRK